MTETVSGIYVVKRGDTLSGIARTTGKSISELVRLNQIKDKNKIAVGQRLYLSDRKAFAAQGLFVDALRHPIENLRHRLVFDGKMVAGITGSLGLTQEVVTKDASSKIEIQVLDFEGYWRSLGSTVSGYGKKLITLVSPHLVFKGQLEPHPPGAPVQADAKAHPQKTSIAEKPALPPKVQGESSKNNPAVKLRKTKGKKGESVIQIGIDLPQELLAFMQAYEDRRISEKEWELFAGDLECEVNVLKAIAKVESGGNVAFWAINDASAQKAYAPKILFERHYFHRLTQGKHDKVNPDISWPAPYKKSKYLNQRNAKMHDGQVDRDDIYDNKQDYLRLVNAYRLDKEAALKSASWGKFQIMGANYAICGQPAVEVFVQKMCKNEVWQIELLSQFIRHKPRVWKDPKNKSIGKEISLWNAVKTKNWHAIAFNYNGPGYKRDNDYDRLLEEAYETYCKTAL